MKEGKARKKEWGEENKKETKERKKKEKSDTHTQKNNKTKARTNARKTESVMPGMKRMSPGCILPSSLTACANNGNLLRSGWSMSSTDDLSPFK